MTGMTSFLSSKLQQSTVLYSLNFFKMHCLGSRTKSLLLVFWRQFCMEKLYGKCKVYYNKHISVLKNSVKYSSVFASYVD